MKTANPHVRVFNTLEGAVSAYANTYYKPVRLLVLQSPTGRGDFFVDTTPNEKEMLHNVWPGKYKVVREKDGKP